MNRTLYFLNFVLLVLFSCGDDDVSGGATDIGNGYVSGTFIGTVGSKTVVSLATVDYYKDGGKGQILYDTIAEGETFAFENVDSGSYTLWAGDEKSNQYLRSHIEVKGDSTYIKEAELKPFGSVVFDKGLFDTSSNPIGLYIPGTDIISGLTIDSSGNFEADSLPAGTYAIIFKDSTGDVTQDNDTVTVVSESVVEKNDEYILTALSPNQKSNVALTLKVINDTLWCGSDFGLGFYSDGTWNYDLPQLVELRNSRINDIERVGGKLILASSSALIVETEESWDTINNSDTFLEFERQGDTLWILGTNSVMKYYDETLHSLEIDTLFDPQGKLTAFAVTAEGEIWVGTDKMGVYHYNTTADSAWHKKNNFSNWESATHKDLSVDNMGTVWLSTEGEGLYYYQNDFWAKILFEDHDKKVKVTSPLGDSSIVIITYGGVVLHDAKGYISELSTFKFNKDASYQIETIYVDNNERIYLGSNGQGVYYVELK